MREHVHGIHSRDFACAGDLDAKIYGNFTSNQEYMIALSFLRVIACEFQYFGFRYVEVFGLPEGTTPSAEMLTAHVV